MERKNKHYVKVTILISILSLISFTLLLGQNKTSNPIEIIFESNGDKIHGWFYKAEGKGPFPTVILLHGFPGWDGDLYELGQNLINEGFNALTFNYSGTWKSEGIWTAKTSIKSVESAIDFLQSQKSIKTFGIDTSNITLIGDSYGGGMALLGSLYSHSVKRVISIAGGDLYVLGKMIEENPDFRKTHQQFLDKCMSDSTVCRGYGGKITHERFLKYKDDFNLKKFAEKLSEKNILLLGGWLDHTITIEDHILPLYRALQKQEAMNLEIYIFNTDHSFKNVRDELRLKIISWLKK